MVDERGEFVGDFVAGLLGVEQTSDYSDLCQHWIGLVGVVKS